MSVTGHTTDGTEFATVSSETEVRAISWANDSLWVQSTGEVTNYDTTGDLVAGFEIAIIGADINDSMAGTTFAVVTVTPTTIIATSALVLTARQEEIAIYAYPLDGSPPTTLTTGLPKGHVFGTGDDWFFISCEVRRSTRSILRAVRKPPVPSGFLQFHSPCQQAGLISRSGLFRLDC
jgi:hypothetical protein